MGAGGAVSFMQNGKIAAGFPRSPAESGTEASRAKARALAERVMPFVPRRVVRAFAEGFLNGAATGAVTPAPEPRLTDAAVLVLDVSGFTKLSEKYSRQGSKGAEAFTLNISSMFARMTTIIRNFHGDVDCFAGDAVLVLFETRTRRTAPRDSTESACDDLCCAALRAVNCAKEVHQQINGYQSRPDDPPLTIHCALAAGMCQYPSRSPYGFEFLFCFLFAPPGDLLELLMLTGVHVSRWTKLCALSRTMFAGQLYCVECGKRLPPPPGPAALGDMHALYMMYCIFVMQERLRIICLSKNICS
jgi:class 3 adenylate cyclase